MTFAFPIALTLTVLALPIVALYILKVRLRRVPVSTNLFWRQIYEEKPPRSLWQHFRDLMSLMLQLLLLLLLAVAVADPYFSWQLLKARRVVIIVDNSASMRAADVRPTRLDAAKKMGLELIEGLRFRDETAVIVAGHAPEVVVGMTDHAPTSLRRAINAIDFSDNPTSLTAAVELGRQLIGKHPHGQIVVLTDGCVDSISGSDVADGVVKSADKTNAVAASGGATEVQTHASTDTKADVPVEYRLFAAQAANVGITQLQVRRSLNDPLGYEIFACIRNASASSLTCRLELTLNDSLVDVIPLRLQPEEFWSRSIEKTAVDGGVIQAKLTGIAAIVAEGESGNIEAGTTATATAELSPLDCLTTDNFSWALLPARRTQKVLIVSQGNLFLQKVFEANPLVEITTMRDFPDQWPMDSLIVVHRRLPATLPSGNVFVIEPVGNCDQWELGDILENPLVSDQDKASPLMTHIRLDNVLVPEARKLLFKLPPHALAKTVSGDIVYGEVKRPNGKCLVLSINLDRSDLTFRTTFPIMVGNALSWFSGTSGELLTSVPTGAITTRNVDPAGTADSLREAVSTRTFDVILSDSSDESLHPATVGPFNATGVWQLRRQSKATDQNVSSSTAGVVGEIAVNLANERETDLRPLKDLQNRQLTAINSTRWFSKPFWFYLVIAACVLTSVEWFLYHRRFIS